MESEEAVADLTVPFSKPDAVTIGQGERHNAIEVAFEERSILAAGACGQFGSSPCENEGAEQEHFHARREHGVAGLNGEFGEVRYVWLNRKDTRVEPKRSLIQKVGNYIVGVGYYLD